MNHSCERVAQSPGRARVVKEHLIFERPGADERRQNAEVAVRADKLDAAAPSRACCALTLRGPCA